VNDAAVRRQSRAVTEPQRETTPPASTIKETSFVCQGKRGFLALFHVMMV
jgi:hypothetical protein